MALLAAPAAAVSGLLLLLLLRIVTANPFSKPYIPFRTDPYDQPSVNNDAVDWNDVTVQSYRSRIHKHDAMNNTHCPLQFVLGVSKRLHGSSSSSSSSAAITQAPVIYPVYAAQGPGRQVVYATQNEHLDLLTPASLASSNTKTTKTKTKSSRNNSGRQVKEMLVQAPDFPLLLEGSSFHTSPILHDVNGDGRMDAIIADYDGGIFMVGLTSSASAASTSDHRHHGRSRLFQSAQVPRLYVRRDWMQGRVNESLGIIPPATLAPHPEVVAKNKTQQRPQENIHDPYHSYFEMYSSNSVKNDKDILRGVTANVLRQDATQWQAVQERRRRQAQLHVQVKEDGSVFHDEDAAGGGGGVNGSDTHDEEHGGSEEGVAYDDDDAMRDLSMDDLAWEQAKQRRAERYGGRGHEYPDRREKGGIARLPEEPEQEMRHSEEGLVQENESDGNHRRLEEEAKVEQDQPDAQDQLEGHKESDPGQALPAHSESDHDAAHEQQGEHGHDLDGDVAQPDMPEEPQQPLEDRMQQQQLVEEEVRSDADRSQQAMVPGNSDSQKREEPVMQEQGGLYDDFVNQPDRNRDMPEAPYDDYGIDDPNPYRGKQHQDPAHDDYKPDHGLHDDYEQYGRDHYDDYYRYHNSAHQEYYDAKHYIRISPHVLATPTLADLPKLYSNTDEKEEILFIPVSFYLDEDEYEGYYSYQRFTEKDHGDETEIDRGNYVASAVLAYILGDNPRWSGQQHLDLSSDFSAPQNVTVVGELHERADRTRMGAFALASPTVADIDGDGKPEVLLGTSMGIVYCLDARTLIKKEKWPARMQFPVESRVVVDDVAGDTQLEVLVADVGGNIVCFGHDGTKVWHRNLANSVGATPYEISGSSSMVLGDVNGDGKLDVVIALTLASKVSYLFVLDAADGSDLINFPLELDPQAGINGTELHSKLPQPLIVDLSTDHSFVDDYIRRRGVQKKHVLTATHKAGLHIVYPIGETLYIIDASSGCTHAVAVGEVITAPVQVDDVHGTNKLDLVISTKAGNVITLESQTPYHPLNIWSNGETRSRFGGSTHGYSAPQGIYVHELSRQYVDVFGVYVHVTLEVFDNRKNVPPEHRKYSVEIRDGSSHKRTLLRTQYDEPGIYTERLFIRYGPGYYGLHVLLTTSHGLVYEDVFHIGYNVHYMSGFGALLWLPLVFFALIIVIFATRRRGGWGDDTILDDVSSDDDDGRGRSLPT